MVSRPRFSLRPPQMVHTGPIWSGLPDPLTYGLRLVVGHAPPTEVCAAAVLEGISFSAVTSRHASSRIISAVRQVNPLVRFQLGRMPCVANLGASGIATSPNTCVVFFAQQSRRCTRLTPCVSSNSVLADYRGTNQNN